MSTSKDQNTEAGKKVRRFPWKKILIIGFSIIAGIFILVIALASPITKYLVEKYDMKYTGREIKIGLSYVNPFTGYIHFRNVRIYEHESDSLFFTSKGLILDIGLRKLFSGTYEFNSIIFDHPKGLIQQDKKMFNFSDLVEKFSPVDTMIKNREPLHLNFLNIEIVDGEFRYNEKVTPVDYSIMKVNLKSPGIYWNSDTLTGKISFRPINGQGRVNGDFMLNTNSMEYRFDVIVERLEMALYKQYLQELTGKVNFNAFLDASLHATGILNDQASIDARGKIAISDFRFGKTEAEDFASFDKLSVGILRLAPNKKIYMFDSVILTHPYFKYESYDYLDNFSRNFADTRQRYEALKANPERFNLIVEAARFTKILFKNFLHSDYKIRNLLIENGDARFEDYTPSEKYSVAINPFRIQADSVDNNEGWVKINLESMIKPFGSLSANLSMNPKDNSDFNLNYHFSKIPAASFNPYLITYTSFPLDRGTIELAGNWQVRNDQIQSTNHFIAIDPRVTKRIRKKDSKWMPMPLIMSFIRERGNVIDYEIPITGNLKNPKFHLHDVLMDLLKNIFVKPPTTPYRLEVKNSEQEIEKLLTISWSMRQVKLRKPQVEFLETIAEFLKKNPDVKISIHPYQYAEKEKEYILFFEAKKKYYLSMENRKAESMSEDDSSKIEKIASKDSLFVRFLDKQLKDTSLFTIQEKCSRYVGADLVSKEYKRLVETREKEIREYFKKHEVEKQLRFSPVTNTIPFNGFSYFKINYPGEIPKDLMEAYEKLNDFNSKPPRNKYQEWRKGVLVDSGTQ